MDRRKIVGILVLLCLILPTMYVASPYISNDEETTYDNEKTELSNEYPNPLTEKVISFNTNGTYYPENWSFIKYLKDNPNEYRKIWEPWITKAAIHAVVSNDNGTMIALGGGYLYDNEIHIYRWNYVTQNYEKIWDSGDGIIQGDVVSLDFADTDNNKLMELVAGSADGHVYVFEQRHIFDPITNTEHMFDLVWKSEFLGPVWRVKVFDMDLDFDPDIVVGTWDNKIYMFEYRDHSGYPYSLEHWIQYRTVWESPKLDDKVLSFVCGDINDNGLPDMLVGLRNGKLVLFENNGTIITDSGFYFALPQDNSYKIIWTYDYGSFFPILDMSIGDLDDDGVDEVSIIEAGREAYVLDYDKDYGGFILHKLYYPAKSFELNPPHPVDYYIDWMVEGTNVFFYNGSYVPEPYKNIVDYVNTGMAGEPDGNYSVFLPNSTHNACAVLDFGVQEEAAGDGVSTYDIRIKFVQHAGADLIPDSSKIRFYGSMDGYRFVELTDYFTTNMGSYAYTYINIDPVLKENSWRHIRYLKILVFNGSYAIDAIYTYDIDKQLSDVTSTLITDLNLDYYGYKKYLLFGTVNGRIVIFHYNSTSEKYEMLYDSLDEDKFYLERNIWDIIKVKPDTRFPYWTYEWNTTLDLGMYKMLDYDYYDIDHDGNYDLLLGTYKGDILVYRYSGGKFINDSATEDYIYGSINSANLKNITPMMYDILNLKPEKPGRELIISAYSGGKYEIWICYTTNPVLPRYDLDSAYRLSKREMTGKLYSLLEYSYIGTPITFDVADVDGNEYSDIVLAIKDKLYMLWHIGGDASGPMFVLDEDYFAEISDYLKNKKPFKPQFVDFNNDGVYDLVVSYLDKNGTTYFENIGTPKHPIWVHKPTLFANSLTSLNPITNYKFRGFTLSEIEKIDDTYWLVANRRNTKEIHIFKGETEGIQTLALATYPLLSLINFAPVVPTASKKNFGYHIFEVWTNHRDLHGWTQTIYTGDVDGDGKGEVIVGDFDNNVYIFEHLINNTYKRAFRSNDLYYEIVTNTSPYYSEELTGLEATFKRRIWEHARYLVANTDIDGDNHLEVIVATKYQIFVFEHQQYENYILEYQYSFLDHPLGSTLLCSTNGISAFAYADDMDYNGYGEVVVALDNFLFVLEMTPNGFIETFNYLAASFRDKFEDFYNKRMYYPLDPVFNLPGNPYTSNYSTIGINFEDYSGFEIRALLVADLDKNGHMEIIMGGLNKSTKCKSLRDGFLYSIENLFGTYYIKWIAPENITYRNGINVLEIDDQDYDGKMELYAGGDKGVDVFEADESTYLKRITTISGDPNHPFVNNSAIINQVGIGYSSHYIGDSDIVVTPSGRIFVFFRSLYTTTPTKTGEIYYVYSDNDGKSWSSPIVLATASDYGVTPYDESRPRVIYADGKIHIAWSALIYDSGYIYTIVYRTMDPSTLSLSSINYVVNSSTSFVGDLSIWRYPFIIWIFVSDIGISYVNTSDNCIYAYTHWNTGWLKSYKIDHVYDGNWTQFLKHDIAYIGPSKWIMAFISSNNGDPMGRQLIWTSVTSNFTNWTMPVAIYETYEPQISPSIEYIEDEGIIVAGGDIYSIFHPYKHFIVVSTNEGQTWSEPKFLYSYHPRVRVICDNGIPRYQFFYRDYYDLGAHFTFNLRFSAVKEGKFVYSFPAMITYDPLGTEQTVYDVIVGVRTEYEFLRYDIGRVDAMAVGDTDGDWRREVIVNKDDNIVVVEICDNNETFRRYTQKSIIGPLNNTIWDIAVGDTNGNGWQEIIVSLDYGNVYSYEFIHTDWDVSELKVPNLKGSRHILSTASGIIYYELSNIDSDLAPEYCFADKYFIYAYDYNASDFDWLGFSSEIVKVYIYAQSGGAGDFIVGVEDGTVYRVDGDTFTIIDSVRVFINGLVDMVINNDTLFVANKTGYIVGLDLNDFSIVYGCSIKVDDVVGVGVINSFGSVFSILIQVDNGTMYSIAYPGSAIMWSLNLTALLNGSIFTYDINMDGVDEIIAQNETSSYELYVLEPLNGSVIYKLEYVSPYPYRWFEIANIDNDEYVDIFAYTQYGEVAISTKNFDAIWYADYPYYREFYRLGDFNGDGVTEILASYNGGFILSNSYGCPMVTYSAPDNRTFMTIGDIDLDGFMEVVGFLENGSFFIINMTDFNESRGGVAYLEPNIAYEKQILDPLTYGTMAVADITNDGYDDVIITNGTFVIGYDIKEDDAVFKYRSPMMIREILTGDFLGEGYNSSIVLYGDQRLIILNSDGNEIFDDKIVTGNAHIIRAFIGDFQGTGKDVVIVVTSKYTYIVDESGVNIFLLIGANTYPIIGNFDGDGYPDIAYKVLVTRELYVYRGDGSFMWSKTLSTISMNRYTYDIFALDYNNDGIDDIVFTECNGTIKIYDGSSGTELIRIYTNVPSYGLSVDKDLMYGTAGITVKYANYGIYVFKETGTTLYYYPDKSTSTCFYMPLSIGETIFSMTPGKIFGVNRANKTVYKPLDHETVAFSTINMGTEKYIVTLSRGGIITLIDPGMLKEVQIKAAGLEEKGNASTLNMLMIYIVIPAILSIATIIYVVRKIKE